MEKLGVILGAMAVALGTAVLMAWPTQWLWNNALVGAINGIHPIGFWQALGITVLCNALFKPNTSSK